MGLMISRMGDAFTFVALTWFVLQLTGSGLPHPPQKIHTAIPCRHNMLTIGMESASP